MRLTSRPACLAGLSLLAATLATPAAAQAPAARATVDAGRQEYVWHCAVCHGDTGTGNGEMRKFLTVHPADLTTIAKRNGGKFPEQLVWEIIDGRTEVQAHGSRDMPVWGLRYKKEAQADPANAGATERVVRDRIVSLLDYLSRIQAK